MHKFSAFILAVFFCTFAVSAYAKVCFLPGVLSGDGCMTEEEGARCPGFERTTPCLSGCDQSTCVSGGVTYYRCVCRNDNITHDLGTKYECLKPYDPDCGCGATDTICNKAVYPYQGCGGYIGTIASSESCQSPKDGKIWYKSCDCPSGVYPFDCKTPGLKEPGNSSMCQDTTGKKKYSFCICAEGWSTTPCSSRSDGCSNMTDHVFNGLDTCYACSEETCPITTQVNLEAYWCDISQVTKVNCAELGYTYAPSGKCSDGSSGLKCPFDQEYVYCPDGTGTASSCKYASKTDCEFSNAGFTCTANDAGCYTATGCAMGYVTIDKRLTISHTYASVTADGLTCYKPNGCQSGFVTSNAGSCTEYTSSGFKCYSCPCAAGYAKSISGCGSKGSLGWTLGTKDGNGCGLCTAKTCPAAYKAALCQICKLDPVTNEQTCTDAEGVAACYNGDRKLCKYKSSSGSGGATETDCCAAGYKCECGGKCSNTCSTNSCALCFTPNE